MVNNVEGHIFDAVKTTAKQFSKITNSLANNSSRILKGYGAEFSATASGLTVTIASGWAVVQGRYVYIENTKEMTIPANYTGFIAVEIDLSESNVGLGSPDGSDYTFTNNQVDIVLVTNPVNGNILANDTLTHFVLYNVTSNSTTATLTKNSTATRSFITKEINVGYGLKATATRLGDLVTLSVNSNQTISMGNGYLKLSEVIPLGFRPIVDVTMDMKITIAQNFEENRRRFQLIHGNGTMEVFAKNMNVTPLTCWGTITYMTDDPII